MQSLSKLTTFGRGIRSIQKHNFGATIDIYVYVKIGRAQLPDASVANGRTWLVQDLLEGQWSLVGNGPYTIQDRETNLNFLIHF